MKRYLFLLAAVACLAACDSGTTEEQGPLKVIILQMNDVYEIAPLEGGESGGLARVATLKKQLEAEAPVISVLSGDFLSPSLLGTLRVDGKKIAGMQMVETLNALGLDYVTFGNHEFDLDQEDLQVRIDSADFTWISSNTFAFEEGKMQPFTQNGEPLPLAVVHPVAQGPNAFNLAFIGICLPFNQEDFVRYTSYDSATQVALASVQGQYQVPLAITHLNWVEDTAYANRHPQFPLIMGGHDHEHMYKITKNGPVAKADANAKTVYVHRLSYYPNGDSTHLESELVYITDSIAEDSAVAQVVARWEEIGTKAINEMGYDPDKVVMETETPLDGREATIRNEPTNLGRLSTAAVMDQFAGLDLVLLNSGSIRLDDQLIGKITMYDILRTFPYGGPMVTTSMKGSDLQEILKIGLETNVGMGGYLQTGNVSKADDGSYLIGGEAIQPDKMYQVAVTSFMSGGGESNLGMLRNYTYTTPNARTAAKNDIRDVVATYMEGL